MCSPSAYQPFKFLTPHHYPQLSVSLPHIYSLIAYSHPASPCCVLCLTLQSSSATQLDWYIIDKRLCACLPRIRQERYCYRRLRRAHSVSSTEHWRDIPSGHSKPARSQSAYLSHLLISLDFILRFTRPLLFGVVISYQWQRKSMLLPWSLGAHQHLGSLIYSSFSFLFDIPFLL